MRGKPPRFSRGGSAPERTLGVVGKELNVKAKDAALAAEEEEARLEDAGWGES